MRCRSQPLLHLRVSAAIDLKPLPLRDVSREEIVEAIAQARQPVTSFVGVNAHTAYLLEQRADFRSVAAEAYRFCDGFGVHLLALAQGLPRPQHRNTPTDFMWPVFARLAREGKSVYLVGDEPGVAERFGALLEGRHPGLVCGHHHGFFQGGSAEEAALIAEIAAKKPHLLCVGMGQPRQELWVHQNRERLAAAAALHLGASMAFAIGARRRGPQWATDRGLEWLFRVLHEPRRMFSRYFVEIPWLVQRALRHRAGGGGARQG